MPRRDHSLVQQWLIRCILCRGCEATRREAMLMTEGGYMLVVSVLIHLVLSCIPRSWRKANRLNALWEVNGDRRLSHYLIIRRRKGHKSTLKVWTEYELLGIYILGFPLYFKLSPSFYLQPISCPLDHFKTPSFLSVLFTSFSLWFRWWTLSPFWRLCGPHHHDKREGERGPLWGGGLCSLFPIHPPSLMCF